MRRKSHVGEGKMNCFKTSWQLVSFFPYGEAEGKGE